MDITLQSQTFSLARCAVRCTALDKYFRRAHTGIVLQLIVNKEPVESAVPTLMDLRRGDAAFVERIDLPDEDARRLMELGFLPGARVVAGASAPGGDPRVFQVDGSEIALRRETARRLTVQPERRVARTDKTLRHKDSPRT